ncbi:hypothetical protein ACFFIS_06975 [Virgibacillus soli]|uniref:Uncharacterized protein n=1 Tax=Paracerasibacillus soli TaxID=480284 RepID=A0ABU5CPE9_9BACI|nr:hypothetical protein [Virgibacillus soli]MDY0407699.1 hypothetical protein [Virgibacillus soli]
MEKTTDAGEKIEHAAKALMRQGVPHKAATYAASMGYLRNLKKK